MKNIVSHCTTIAFILLLIGCTENETIEKLTRVDFFKVTADGDYADEIIIADLNPVDEIKPSIRSD